MEACRRVEFTGVELVGGAEIVAPVEKAVLGPCTREGRGMREAQWRGRKTGYRAWAWWRCWPTERRPSGEGGAVESAVAKTARRSTVAALR